MDYAFIIIILYTSAINKDLIPIVVPSTKTISSLKEIIKEKIPDESTDFLAHDKELLDDTNTLAFYNIKQNDIIIGLSSVIKVFIDFSDKEKTVVFDVNITDMGYSLLEKVKHLFKLTNFNLTTPGKVLLTNATLFKQEITNGTHIKVVIEVNGDHVKIEYSVMNLKFQNGEDLKPIPITANSETIISSFREYLRQYLPDGSYTEILTYQDQVLDDSKTIGSYDIEPYSTIKGINPAVNIFINILETAKSYALNVSLLEIGSSLIEKAKKIIPFNLTNFNLTTLGSILQLNATLLQQGITNGTHFQLVSQVNGGLTNGIG